MDWLTSLTKTKSVEHLKAEASSSSGHALKRVLGPSQLVMLGIGDIIGAGIFVLAGLAAAQYGGPAILVSFVLAAVACSFAALCYAEFAAMLPMSGSAYTYAYATLGELPAWIIGCLMTLEFAVGPSAVAVGWSGYVTSLVRDFGVTIPPAFTAPPGTVLVETAPRHWEVLSNIAGRLAAQGIDPATLAHETAIFNLLAAFIVLLMTAVLVIGIQESARVNAAIVVIKVSVILVFIAAGARFVRPENWTPFVPPNTGEFGHFGYSGIVRGAAVVFFAFMGFDSVTTAAQEAKNPQRDLPIGILGSLAGCTVLYILMTIVLTGVVSYTELNVPDPIAVGLDATGLKWLSPFIKLGAICGLSSVVLVGMLAQSRIFYTMANDGLLPPWVARIHPRFRTPHITTIVTGLLIAVIAATTPIGVLGELVSMGTLLTFVIVCAGVMILRKTRPDLPRPFRTPWSPLVPLAGMATCAYLMSGLPGDTWLRLLLWMGAGLVVYVAYGRRHSKVTRARAGADGHANLGSGGGFSRK
jgi:APA family basic amino acid/polyamine antiporter